MDILDMMGPRFMARLQREITASSEPATPKVGSAVRATVHPSIQDFDTSSYQAKPIAKERVKILSITKRKRTFMAIRVLDDGTGVKMQNHSTFRLVSVGKGFWQLIGGESVAYKFSK